MESKSWKQTTRRPLLSAKLGAKDLDGNFIFPTCVIGV
jgi:hypothetical protein